MTVRFSRKLTAITADNEAFLARFEQTATPIRDRVPDVDPTLAELIDTTTAPRGERLTSIELVALGLRSWASQDPPQGGTCGRDCA